MDSKVASNISRNPQAGAIGRARAFSAPRVAVAEPCAFNRVRSHSAPASKCLHPLSEQAVQAAQQRMLNAGPLVREGLTRMVARPLPESFDLDAFLEKSRVFGRGSPGALLSCIVHLASLDNPALTDPEERNLLMARVGHDYRNAIGEVRGAPGGSLSYAMGLSTVEKLLGKPQLKQWLIDEFQKVVAKHPEYVGPLLDAIEEATAGHAPMADDKASRG